MQKDTASDQSTSSTGTGSRLLRLLRSGILLALPVVLLLVILHFVFLGLAVLQGVPEFRFQFTYTNFGQLGDELRDDEDIVIVPPNSYFRKSMPNGLRIRDKDGNAITHYHGIRRGTPFEVKKPAGTKRVLAIGDSVTWGAKIADDRTWPAQLEGLLNANLPEGVEQVQVLNGGIVSSTITNSYESLLYHDLQFEPDVVLLTFCDNDIYDLATETSITPTLYEFLRRSVWFGPVRYFFGKNFRSETSFFANSSPKTADTDRS